MVKKIKKAQTTVEYLLLLMVVAVIVFVGFKTILKDRMGNISGGYFNETAGGIMGEPVPCLQGAFNDVHIIDANASQYLELKEISITGSNPECQKNADNAWCIERGNHWAPSLIGCYEIADDHGDKDCANNADYSGRILYRWKTETYRVKSEHLDSITISVDTSDGSACKNALDHAYEDSDGWDVGTKTFSLTGPAWTGEFCKSHDGGFLRFQALFDEEGYLKGIELRARDHHGEGYFHIFEMKVDVKRELEGTCFGG